MKITTSKLLFVISFILLTFGSILIYAQTMKDMDGKVYRTAKLGIQEWSASNLNVTTFRNGDIIPEAKTKEEWVKAGSDAKPAWCYYKNDPVNGYKNGKLYNWYAINDKRGLAPEGWRISINKDWELLIKNLLGIDYAGPKLKSTNGWKSKNGADKIGFSALPSGLRSDDGNFNSLGIIGQWWSNTEPVEVTKSNLIYSIKLNDNTVEVSYLKVKKSTGLSVRCVRNLK